MDVVKGDIFYIISSGLFSKKQFGSALDTLQPGQETRYSLCPYKLHEII